MAVLTRALAGMPQDDPEMRRGLVRALANRQAGGAALNTLTGGRAGRAAMSGPDPMQLGIQMENAAYKRAYAAERDRIDDEFRANKQAYDAERDQISDARWLAEYDQKDRLAAGKLAAGSKPGTKEMQNIRANTEALTRLDRIKTTISGFSGDERGNYDSPWYELFSGATLTEGLKRRADEGYYSPKVERLLAEGKQWESFVRRAFSGTAVTKYEGANTDAWSPFAPGLSAAQRQNRMNAVEQDLRDTRGIMTEQYGTDYVSPYSPSPANTGGGTRIGRFTVEVE